MTATKHNDDRPFKPSCVSTDPEINEALTEADAALLPGLQAAIDRLEPLRNKDNADIEPLARQLGFLHQEVADALSRNRLRTQFRPEVERPALARGTHDAEADGGCAFAGKDPSCDCPPCRELARQMGMLADDDSADTATVDLSVFASETRDD